MPNEFDDVNDIICKSMLNSLKSAFEIKEDIFEDTEEGQDLYKGSFSLAYGALTLLNSCHLHLKRNRFYGLLGPNNCGKTTLMRAISNEQVEGFPKRDELKTVFVEHEIQEREVGEDDKGFPILNIDLCGVDWVVDCCNEVYKLDPPVDKDAVEKVMEEIGFGNSKRDKGHDRAADAWMGVTTYSGGWKMKMQLCAATLMNADILMLDEPTGHLDVTNIAWIKNWLNSFIKGGGSIIATSHDSSFLDEMCTHLIDFQNRKLKTFRGNYGTVLKEFVEKYPEKKGYFELKNDVMKFKFPDPTSLEGVKSLTKSILRMKNITFTYPTRDKPTIMDVSLECSRASRVGVVGANGAGKSTAIKILIGELKPEVGEMWKHPNLRLAYIAQHAFHHLEKHIHKTATQYILWRFAGNEDKENVELLNKDPMEEEEKPKKKYMINPKELTELKECFGEEEERKAVEPEKILGRRDNKKDKIKEYEVKFKDKSVESNMWIPRDILINMGAIALIQRQDEKEAVAAGLMSKPLTSKSVEEHLTGFGIEPEHASHTLIKSLSGGQKVKVVLAASLWQNPHLVILDEPTNYLDRDGLGALTKAIDEFKGGIIIISHNKEFVAAVAEEKWIMEKGRLRKEGESIGRSNDEESQEQKLIGDDIVKDSFGNEIKVDKKKELTDKEKKQEVKKLQKKLKEAKKKGTMTEDDMLDLEAKIDELKK
jgi:elongation factor 3